MALKADRRILETDITNYCNEVANRGQFVVYKTTASGVAMDSTSSVVGVTSSSSGQKPAGLLLQEVVAVDLTRFPINWHRDQANSGDKVTLLTKGWVATDQITGTPVAGDTAVLSSSGTVASTTKGSPFNEVANPRVGRFMTSKDQSGYARLYVDV